MENTFVKTPKNQKKIFEFFKSANKIQTGSKSKKEQNLDASIINVSSDDDFEPKNVARKNKILAKRRNISKVPTVKSPENEKKRKRSTSPGIEHQVRIDTPRKVTLRLKKDLKTTDDPFEMDSNSDFKIFTSTQITLSNTHLNDKENGNDRKKAESKPGTLSPLREIPPNNKESKLESLEQNLQAGDKMDNKEGDPEKILSQEIGNISLNDSMDALFHDDWQLSEELEEELLLDLEKWQKCTILNVDVVDYSTVIKVQSLVSNSKAVCVLKQTWTQIKLAASQTVNIIAKKINDTYEINNEHGFLILAPNTLVTGTALMGFMYCNRKTILSYKYGGNKNCNKVMTCGFLIHELLQETLKRKVFSVDAIKALCHELIHRKDTISKLYEVQMGTEETLKEITPFAEKVSTFVQTYVKTEKSSQRTLKSGNWNGYIKKIHDIEENLWCPRLGIKGKIDVSVEAQLNTKSSSKCQVIPLELKTGRATMSPEHQGQVALYNMMLRETGFDSPSGLLLYLRENVIKEVELTRREERDLIILRNNFVYYLNKTHSVKFVDHTVNFDENSDKTSKTHTILAELPPPINNKRMCENCEQLTMCAFLQSKSLDIDGPQIGKLDAFYQEKINYLTPQHVQYFQHWIQAIQIEMCSKILTKPVSDIWEYTPLERENKGKSLSNLIVKTVKFENGFYNTLFITNTKVKNRDFLSSGLIEGNYLIVSSTDRVSIAAGFVLNITKVSISLALERNLNDRYAECEFCIDFYDIESYDTIYLTSLSLLMQNNDNSKRLREIIIERKTPVFSSGVPKKVVDVSAEILNGLNQMQQKAIYRVFASKNYLLINGMPGTGKTQTLVALIEILFMLKKSVLITSHTHSAVDNVLGKLLESHRIDPKRILKIGSELRTSPIVKPHCENILIKACKTVEELEAFYDNCCVVGVTCFGAYHPLLERKTFDICIVDESTQILQSIVIKPLMSAKIFVLVGDPEQLPPIVHNEHAKEMGMEESLFECLFDSDCTEHLTLQYRMNKTINSLANKLTYNGKLMCGNTTVAENCLQLNEPVVINENWMQSICDHSLDNAVKFVDTGTTIELNALYFTKYESQHPEIFKTSDFNINKLSNVCEAAIILQIVKALLHNGLNTRDIGIIAPFQAQVTLLRLVFKNFETDPKRDIEINTVDQYQGRDKKVVIFSCTKTENLQEKSILADKRRLNVAITRAKQKLIIIGYKKAVEAYKSFARLFKCLERHQIQELRDNNDQFTWNSVLDQLSSEIREALC